MSDEVHDDHVVAKSWNVAEVVCCGCGNTIAPSEVANCPHCAKAGNHWNDKEKS